MAARRSVCIPERLQALQPVFLAHRRKLWSFEASAEGPCHRDAGRIGIFAAQAQQRLRRITRGVPFADRELSRIGCEVVEATRGFAVSLAHAEHPLRRSLHRAAPLL